MTELLYKLDKWGGCTFDIMSRAVHEYHKWMSDEEEWVLTVEPTEEMIRDLNRICRPAFTGNSWTFEGLPDYPDKWWLGAEDAQKRGQLVRMRFEFCEPKLVPLFKLSWHGR